MRFWMHAVAVGKSFRVAAHAGTGFAQSRLVGCSGKLEHFRAKTVSHFWRENALLHVADAGCEAFGRFILFAFALFRQGRSLEQLMDR